MKIIILTSEKPGNVWLVNQLLESQDVAGIVIERRPLALKKDDKVERWRRMKKRYGLRRTVNKLLFNQVRSRFLSGPAAHTFKESFFPGGAAMSTRVRCRRSLSRISTRPRASASSRSTPPDVLAVCGTSVLKPEVFTLAPKGTINIHTGITPEYRSADPIFWALYQGEPDKVGVTIHYVDRGIDTGPIIYQESVPVYADDSLPSIAVRCIRKGGRLYLRALEDLRSGTVRTLDRSHVKGRSFYSVDMGLYQYVMFRLRFRRLASRLPRRDTASTAPATGVN